MEELTSLGVSVFANSVDNADDTKNIVSPNLSFNLAYGATIDDANAIGAWWSAEGDDREYIQPSEFIINRGGTVLGSMYASGPVGRFSPEEATRLITSREKRIIEEQIHNQGGSES